MHALVTGGNNTAAGLRRTIFPARDDTAGAGNDRHKRHGIVRLGARRVAILGQ
jgi:hypothetical protein